MMVVVVVGVGVVVVVGGLVPSVAAERGSSLGQEHTGVLGGSAESCGEAPDQFFFEIYLSPQGRTRGRTRVAP